ncbi:MAG: sulD [Acidimicrobiia bacterium]|nr:sulD [Acidimicrobiia bacterium]
MTGETVARRAFLGLGSNLGDRAAQLRAAVAALPDVHAVSSVYETAPVGGPEDQGRFLNLVVELRTALTARELLQWCGRLEQAAARVRTVKDGPRTLDVDVLWIDGVTVDDPDLVVPHPRMFERAFVLAPLAELAPDIVPADWAEGLDQLDVVREGSLTDTE